MTVASPDLLHWIRLLRESPEDRTIVCAASDWWQEQGRGLVEACQIYHQPPVIENECGYCQGLGGMEEGSGQWWDCQACKGKGKFFSDPSQDDSLAPLLVEMVARTLGPERAEQVKAWSLGGFEGEQDNPCLRFDGRCSNQCKGLSWRPSDFRVALKLARLAELDTDVRILCPQCQPARDAKFLVIGCLKCADMRFVKPSMLIPEQPR